MGYRKLLFARMLAFGVCSWMNSELSSVQKIICIAAIADKKIISVFCMSRVLCSPSQSPV